MSSPPAPAPHPERRGGERCAPRADQRQDPMLGTAFPAARLLLVEEPYPWDFEGLRTSRFDRAMALALEARARAEGVRVQAIRRPGRSGRTVHRRWAIVDTRDATPSLRWGQFTDDAQLLELALDGSDGEPDSEPLFLVCTHGKHDPCCALRGRPVLAALDVVCPGRVWQASHLGGCRFAPTVLALPLGVMYGRVLPSDAAELVQATGAGEVLAARLRGRIGIPPVAQAAIGYAQAQLSVARAREISLVSTTAVGRNPVTVRIRSPLGLYDVTVTRERVDATGLTCAAPAASWFVAHRPLAIEPVRDG